MRLREWVRRGRITTPPRALPLVLLGFLAIAVAWAVIAALAGMILLVEALLGDEEDLSALRVAASTVVQTLIAVAGCWLLRRFTAEWVHRQPPEPPRVDR
jgi:predicted Na+-dependent transporter